MSTSPRRGKKRKGADEPPSPAAAAGAGGPPASSPTASSSSSSTGDKDKEAASAAQCKKYEHGQVCHIDIPCHDVKRVAAFYKDVFEWTVTPFKDHYAIWRDKAGLGGGYEKVSFPIPFLRTTTFHLYCTNINDVIPKIVAAGGAITKPKYVIGENIGANALFMDTEGNVHGIYSMEKDEVKVSTVNQTVNLKVSRHDAFEIFVDAKRHAEATAMKKCTSERRPLGKFTCDEYIMGNHIEMVTDHKIVQSWRGADFPPAHYSLLTITFADRPAGGCVATLVHEYVPADKAASIATGWHTYYWNHIGKYE